MITDYKFIGSAPAANFRSQGFAESVNESVAINSSDEAVTLFARPSAIRHPIGTYAEPDVRWIDRAVEVAAKRLPNPEILRIATSLLVQLESNSGKKARGGLAIAKHERQTNASWLIHVSSDFRAHGSIVATGFDVEPATFGVVSEVDGIALGFEGRADEYLRPIEIGNHALSEDLPQVGTSAFDATEVFNPPPELILAWVQAMNDNLREAGEKLMDEQAAVDNRELANHVAREVRKIIANFGKRKSYEGGRYRITFGGQFLPSIQNLFVDHLSVPPLRAPSVLEPLKKALYAQSTGTPCIQGRWGDLIVDEANELTLRLERRKRRSLASVLRG